MRRVFIWYKRFYWSKAANDLRIGQSDALLEADVIDRMHFNENLQPCELLVEQPL